MAEDVPAHGRGMGPDGLLGLFQYKLFYEPVIYPYLNAVPFLLG